MSEITQYNVSLNDRNLHSDRVTQFKRHYLIQNRLKNGTGVGQNKSTKSLPDDALDDHDTDTANKKPIIQQIPEHKRKLNLHAHQQATSIYRQFIQFVIANQSIRLVEVHPLYTIKSSQWEQIALVYYDQLLNYFLKKSSNQEQVQFYSNIEEIPDRHSITQFILIQDDQFRLELKQYFPAESLKLQVLQLKQDSIANSPLQFFYNRQVNVYGFLVHNSNGFLKEGKFHREQNIMIQLYQKQADLLGKYKDNRIRLMQSLIGLPVPYYMSKYDSIGLEQVTNDLNLYYNYKQQPFIELDDILSGFLDIVVVQDPYIRYLYVNQQEGGRKSNLGNMMQIISYMLQTNLIDMFIRYIGKMEQGKEITFEDFNVRNVTTKYIDRHIQQVQNYDLNFDLRVLQYIYKQTFGFNSAATKAMSPFDFYQMIPLNVVPMMQEKLRYFKVYLNQERNLNCPHNSLLIDSDKLSIQFNNIIGIIQNYAIPIDDGKQLFVDIGHQTLSSDQNNNQDLSDKLTYALDFMHCRACDMPIMCYHQVLDILLKTEAITEQMYDDMIIPFQIRDLNVFSFNSYCKICGASFREKVDLIQIYENIDPQKKYKMIKNTFKILFASIVTPFQFRIQTFFQDFLQHYYYTLKQELQIFKKNTNYTQKKSQITFFFVSAYLQSLTGENVMIDSRLQHKYSQMKTITLEQFNTQVQQIQQKFKIQSSIVVPSLSTVKHLYNSQLNKPIIGSIIRANPELLTQLLINKIPIYPELYQINKFLPYFNNRMETLSPDLITGIINASAVDIMNRASDVVKQYNIVKNNYGRHMERNSTYMTDKITNLDSFVQRQTPQTFDPTHYKDLFYQKYCPISLKPHDINKKCSDCKDGKNGSKSLNSKFKQQFYKVNQIVPVLRYKYIETRVDNLFPTDYNDKQLEIMAKSLQTSYFQVVNFGGFNYLDLSVISKMQSFQQLVEHQVALYTKISHIYIQSSEIEESEIPKDLKFILTMKVNWNVYKSRLTSIIDKIRRLIQSLSQTQESMILLQDFNDRCYHFQHKGTSNFFIDCQTLVNYLFRHIIPQLQKFSNPQLFKTHLNQLFKEDITQADKYSELGAFRHKYYKEVVAENVLQQLQEKQEEQNSDDDNDYIHDLTKNTIDDPDYED